MLRALGDRRKNLDAARARADDRDPLVRQLVEITAPIPPGDAVVPPARVERLPFEPLDMPLMPGNLARLSGPVPIVRNRAWITSPRLVVTAQRERSSRHAILTTVVPSKARA